MGGSARELPSYADAVRNCDQPLSQRRALSQPRSLSQRVRFLQNIRARSADGVRDAADRDRARRSHLRCRIRVSGFSQPLTTDELKAAVQLILPLPEGTQISSRALYDTKVIITLSTEEQVRALLFDMRTTQYKHLNQPLYANRVLEPEQALLGWRLRTIISSEGPGAFRTRSCCLLQKLDGLRATKGGLLSLRWAMALRGRLASHC